MDSLTSNMPLLVFTIIGTIAFASSILVVAMRNPVHSALFLLLTFLCVAVLFVMRDAEFVVMLINVRHLPDERVLSSFWKGGFAVFLGLMILFVTLVRPGVYHDPNPNTKLLRSTTRHVTRHIKNADGSVTVKHIARRKVEGNSQAVGNVLYTDYLVPFEIASIFLLVAMIGAIVIGKRELSAVEEETAPDYMLQRVETEKEVKERVSA